MPVSGWSQCVKWVAPLSIAHSFIAAATASARPGDGASLVTPARGPPVHVDKIPQRPFAAWRDRAAPEKRGRRSFDSGPKKRAAVAPTLPGVNPERGGRMALRRTRWAGAGCAALLSGLVVPSAALADGSTLQLANDGKLADAVGINSIWVLVAGILVMFMQAGVALLEVGLSPGKKAG